MPAGTLKAVGESGGSGAPSGELLAVEGLYKTFPGQRALADLNITLKSGEVHALLGANGSGKSTLVKILTGVYEPDEGAIVRADGEEHELRHGATDGYVHGVPVRAIHQDLGLIGELGIVDNVGLTSGYRSGRLHTISWSEQRRNARSVLAQFGLQDLDLDAPLNTYDKLVQTQVAIARILGNWEEQSGVLILDEPTANLPESHAETLFEAIEGVARAGNAVLYVTHRLHEVFRLASSVTILREGRVVHAGPAWDLDEKALIRHMVGHEVEERSARPPSDSTREGSVPPRLIARDVSFSEESLFSFEARAGEVVGLTGIVGSGHEMLAPALVGAVTAYGKLTVEDSTLDLDAMDPGLARVLGISYVPANRREEGLVLDMSVSDNIALPKLQKFKQMPGLYNQKAADRHATEWGARVDIRPRNPAQLLRLLSGGNQQKVVLARCLAAAPRVLILCDPTVGVDVGAREQIAELLLEAAAKGLTIIVSSTDHGELATLCDRVLVLRSGKVADDLDGPDLTEGEIATAVLSSDT